MKKKTGIIAVIVIMAFAFTACGADFAANPKNVEVKTVNVDSKKYVIVHWEVKGRNVTGCDIFAQPYDSTRVTMRIAGGTAGITVSDDLKEVRLNDYEKWAGFFELVASPSRPAGKYKVGVRSYTDSNEFSNIVWAKDEVTLTN